MSWNWPIVYGDTKLVFHRIVVTASEALPNRFNIFPRVACGYLGVVVESKTRDGFVHEFGISKVPKDYLDADYEGECLAELIETTYADFHKIAERKVWQANAASRREDRWQNNNRRRTERRRTEK